MPFAQDIGHGGPPFKWDEQRRIQIRCELDALFFHLYGLDRQEVEYILDTFSVLRDVEEKTFGAYLTKRKSLEIFENMVAGSEEPASIYRTPLNPPPASPKLCHAASTKPDWLRPDSTDARS